MTASKQNDGFIHTLVDGRKRKYWFIFMQCTYERVSLPKMEAELGQRNERVLGRGSDENNAPNAFRSEKYSTMRKRKKPSCFWVHRFLYFFGVVWLMAFCFLPFASAQPPTTAPQLPVSTTAPPVPSPTAPRPTPQPISTTSPTIIISPTASPTESPQPSFSPTASQQPTWSPTTQPTITPRPTGQPSVNPTDYPSVQPSFAPTAEPTFADESSARTVFNQRFQIGNEREFNETEVGWFCSNMEGYTDDFGGRDDERVNTTCRIISQRLQIIGGNRRLRDGLQSNDERRRQLQGVVFNQVEYGMSYSSNHTNVTTYPTLFQNYVNEDLDRLTTDLQNAGLAVTNSFLAFNNIATVAPTTIPTITPYPTGIPSTSVPVDTPSPVFTRDPATPDETAVPTSDGSPMPTPQSGGGTKRSTVITASVIAALFTVMVGLFAFYRRRKRANERKFQEQAAAAGTSTTATGATGYMSNASRTDMHVDTGQQYDDLGKNGRPETVGMISPADSLVSNGSLLSTGPSPLSEGSEREDDGTHNLADEFDQYKDQNLEKMRTGVEDNVSGVDGMMSQALTKAIMGDDDSEVIDMNELRWGGSGDSIEIEATALYEVTDWLKRKEGATTEERGAFMQETLDKMVASVRHGVMDAECGSRAIHECAALLGLQLASNIPGNTLIVTGMPKWVKREDLLSAFSEFGEIQDAAVAANRRGFGLVRFKSIKSVNNAMSNFRTGEIVVQDVAVMIKVLKSDDAERRTGWPEQAGFPLPPPPGQNLSRHSSRAASPILK